ncbi:putative glycerophosphodiester phosphodiesterase 1 [Lactococcus lactis]|uniref:Phage capsid and scaffold n=1 Tax=Lactococcus lactis subsp. lactis TaxID=1360 RepID=A0A0V8EIY2_LACLL|nr:glycerophosphodiester phosphodiesterase family protein [Lactococcus lactis]KSU25579.1 Phage capsid and scaffold [Lactococcus lactis subsp. lactis]MDU0409412.1 putative glycerophosphodiester phosphodiesterase 1 [Lactococcus lactis]NRD17216.1 BppU family phage baseplate upper protein [Lactococcus lactis subsp. lactis]
MTEHFITLSTTEPNNYVGLLKMRQGDINTQTIQATITANGQLFKFDGLSVFFNAVLPNGNVIRDKVTEVDYINSKLNYVVANSFLQEVAQVTAWFSFENGNKTIDSTKNFQYSVIGGWKECIPQGNYIYELSEIQREIEEIIKNKDFTSLISKISSLETDVNNQSQKLAQKAEQTTANNLQSQVTNLVVNSGNANAEVSQAHGSSTGANFLTLKGHLDDIETSIFKFVDRKHLFDWVVGSLTNGVVQTEVKYRIVTNSVQYAEKALTLKVTDYASYNFGVHTYSYANETYTFLADSGWILSDYIIPAGTYFRLVVKKVGDTTSVLTDPRSTNLFNSLTIRYDGDLQSIKDIHDNVSSLRFLFKEFTQDELQRKHIADGVETISTTRVSTIGYITGGQNIRLISFDPTYKFLIVEYSMDGTYQKVFQGWTFSTDSSFDLTADKKYKLLFGRDIEGVAQNITLNNILENYVQKDDSKETLLEKSLKPRMDQIDAIYDMKFIFDAFPKIDFRPYHIDGQGVEIKSVVRVSTSGFISGGQTLSITSMDSSYKHHVIAYNLDGTFIGSLFKDWSYATSATYKLSSDKKYRLLFGKGDANEIITPQNVVDNIFKVSSAKSDKLKKAISLTGYVSDGKFKPNPKYYSFAHQGLNTSIPNQTYPAYLAAAEAGFNAFECDIKLTSDNVIVLLHDDTIDSMTDGTGYVKDFTYDQLLTYSFNNGKGRQWDDTKILRFDELLLLAKKWGVYLCVDHMSNADTDEKLQLVFDEVIKYGMQDMVMWSGINPYQASWIRSKHKKAILDFPSYWIDHTDDLTTYLTDGEVLISYQYGVDNGSFDLNKITSARLQGFKIAGWTIDDPTIYAQWYPHLDGMFSNKLSIRDMP